MTKSGRHRLIATLALQGPSEVELRKLHEQVSSMGASAFVELVRDIEDEIENSLALVAEKSIERSAFQIYNEGVFKEIDTLRKSHLGMTVMRFAELLTQSILESSNKLPSDLPRFDPRRGLQAWIERLVRLFDEQFVLHAAAKLEQKFGKGRESDWKLR